MDVGELAGSQENATLEWWDSFLSDEVRALRKKMPSDLLFGLDHPNWKADIVYWSQMPNFTLRDVTLLSVGVNPEHYDEKVLPKSRRKKVNEPIQRYALFSNDSVC